MKALILSTTDIQGGAARASYRLLKGLNRTGVKASMLVQHKYSQDWRVLGPKGKIDIIKSNLLPYLEYLPLLFFKDTNKSLHSPALVSTLNLTQVEQLNPDVVSVHWVNRGFVRPETLLKINRPLVLTLLDRWPLSGSEHSGYPHRRYLQGCTSHNRPTGESGWDLNKWVWQRKLDSWQKIKNLQVVALSSWLAVEAKHSPIFAGREVKVIPVGLDQQVYRPIEQKLARKLLGLPLHKKLITFGSLNAQDDPNKGFVDLRSALKKLPSNDDWQLVVFGSGPPEKPIDLGFKTHYVGLLKDDLTLSLMYSASDVVVVPSHEESFGQVALESLACGTPVVAFDTTGLKDIIDHQKNGYLANCFQSDDLSAGIRWVLETESRRKKLGQNGRQKVEQKFTLEHQAQAYKRLYQSLIAKSRKV